MSKLIVVLSICVCALAALIWVGVASAIPVVSVAELNRPDLSAGEVDVKDAKVLEIESLAPLRFWVTHRTGIGGKVLVESPRSVPENFKIGIDVGLRGSYDPQTKVLQAYRVTTKCPSKYEASRDGEAGSQGSYGAARPDFLPPLPSSSAAPPAGGSPVAP